MKRTVRGFVIAPVILIVGAVACVAIGAAGMYVFMSQNQGGLGDGTELAVSDPAEVPETAEASEETIETEETAEPTTQPVTELQGTIVVTVSRTVYLYNGKTYTLEELAGILRSAEADTTVKLEKDHAAARTVRELRECLDENNIPYVE